MYLLSTYLVEYGQVCNTFLLNDVGTSDVAEEPHQLKGETPLN